MGKLKKIFKTVCCFVLIMFLLCFITSIYKFIQGDLTLHEVFPKTGLYFLYMIGYGSLEGDAFLENFFAMIGIISLALMSTFLTLNLFWRYEDVFLQKSVTFDEKKQKFFFQFVNKGKAICDMKVSFMLYDSITNEGMEGAKDYFLPLLLENTSWKVGVFLDDEFWYEALQKILEEKEKHLYCTFSFVDTKTGQTSIHVEEVLPSFFKNKEGKQITMKEIRKPLFLKGDQLLVIENGAHVELARQQQEVKITYQQLNLVEKNQFMMVYYSFVQQPLHLEKYNQETSYLSFSVESQMEMDFDLEIKTMDSAFFALPIHIDKKKKVVELYFKDIPIQLNAVKEICFTIRKGKNPVKNQILLSDIKIVVN